MYTILAIAISAFLPFLSTFNPFLETTERINHYETDASACSAPAFSGSRVSSTFVAASDSVSGDFNMDGKTDVAIKSGLNGTLSIQLATGNGYLGTPRVIDGDSSGFSLAINDFNNDGYLDLLTASEIYFGDGTGNFSEPRPVVLPQSSFNYLSGDFNGDDKADVSSFNFSNGSVEVNYGDGFGGFGPVTAITFTSAAGWHEVGDVNADGITDVFTILNNVNTVSVALGSASGTFQTPANYAIGGTGSVSTVTKGDVDNDGDVDLVASSSGFGEGSSFMVIFINNGSGVFSIQPRTVEPAANINRVFVLDINGDGNADILRTTSLSNLEIKRGNGNGTFQASRQYMGFIGQAKLFFDDFTGDGIRDLGIPSTAVANFAVLVNDSQGNLGLREFIIDDQFFVADLQSADFNGDGKEDIALATESLQVKVALGDGAGGFGPNILIPVTKTPRWMITGDVNNDGKADLLLIVQNNGDATSWVDVVFGNGNGTFQAPVELTQFVGPIRKRPALSDFTGDGFPELVITGGNIQQMSILRNVGSGLFTIGTSINSGTTVDGYAAGDFNNDGKNDLAVLAGSVQINLGSGVLSFENAGNFPSGNANSQIIANDLNGDGILDIVATAEQTGPSPSLGKAYVLIGVGKGGFDAAAEYFVGRGASQIKVADFDSDGNKDIAIQNAGYSNAPDSRVTLLYGNGSGLFPSVRHTAASPFPRGLLVSDFNSDTRPDIVTMGYFAGSNVLLLGQCLAPPPVSLPSLTIANATVAEGNSGNSSVNVQVSLSAPSATVVRVRYYSAPSLGATSLTDETLVEPQGRLDYLPTAGELLFAPGETAKTIQFSAVGDTVDEYDERISVFLANSTNASISDRVGIVTIIDDDAAPSVSIGNGVGAEGNSGNSPINLPLTLSTISEKTVTVNYLTGGGTAVPNSDYVWAQSTAVIAPKQPGTTVVVSAIGDLTVEPNETFNVSIGDATNATIAISQAQGTIQNDDVGGSVQFSSPTFVGTEFGGSAAVTVTRTGGNGGGVSVRFSTQAGTASPGQDYAETVTTLFFAENENSKSVIVPIIFDQLDEFDETVNLTLDNPNGVTIGSPSPAVLTIQNAANVPDLTITDASVEEGDNGTRSMLFSVRLSRPSQRTVTVDYSMQAQNATPGVDFIPTSGTFTIRRGVTRANLSVVINGDFQFEPDETFLVDLVNATNANLVDGQGLGRIINDEVATGSSLKFASMNSSNSGSANADTLGTSVSQDGRFVVIDSNASNIVAGDNNNAQDVFLRNLESGTTTAVSLDTSGTATGNCPSLRGVMSANGRYVVFNSCASNLIPSGPTGISSVYRRDLQTNSTSVVAVNTSGAPAGTDSAGHLDISANGRFVVFQSREPNLTTLPDTQNNMDIFIRDMQSGVTSMVSVNSAGNGPGNANSGSTSSLFDVVRVSPDGRYILFPSEATNLVSTPAAIGSVNLFVRDTVAGTTVPISINAAGTQLVGATMAGSLSDDGRYVYFASGNSTIIPNDTNNAGDVFRRDLSNNTTTLISVNTNGTAGGNAESTGPSASADGRYVAFQSAASDISTTTDTNVSYDVFWRDTVLGTTRLISINSTTSNAANSFSGSPTISRDGLSVIYNSLATDLVPPPLDSNANYDIYLRSITDSVTIPISANEGGTATGNQPTKDGFISANGNVVSFLSGASNLLPNDLNGPAGDAFVYTRKTRRLPIVDFDGDGRTDLGVFRPSDSYWYITNSSDSSFRAQQFGISTDIPVANDYDGDGKTDVAIFRNGVWYSVLSSNNTVQITTFGQTGDKPITGDFDGDRRSDLGIFRNGIWQIRESSDGNVRTVQFGLTGDAPTAADFDGDRRTDVGIFRAGTWYIIESLTFNVRIAQFGSTGDLPVHGDFDGDEKADLAVFRPSTGVWYVLNSGNGSFYAAQFGLTGDVPLRGDFDGDGKADLSIFRNGVWYLLDSTTGGFRVFSFGSPNDLAIPGQ